MTKSFSFSLIFSVLKSNTEEDKLGRFNNNVNNYCIEKRSISFWGELVHTFMIVSAVKLFDSQHWNTSETPAPSLSQFKMYLKCEYRNCSNKSNSFSEKHILIQMKEKKNRIIWAEQTAYKLKTIWSHWLKKRFCQWCIHKMNSTKWKGSVTKTWVDYYEMLSTKMSIIFEPVSFSPMFHIKCGHIFRSTNQRQ